jgi:hypothetical protein
MVRGVLASPAVVMRRLAWISALAIAVACGVDLPDTPGRACDDDHPCREGRACVLGRCFSVEELDAGGTGGGTGGGGGSGGTGGGVGGGGGATFDAGRVLWSQSNQGFTGQDVMANCMLEIDTVRSNRVVSTIGSSTQNRAVAINANAATLALGGNGRLRGKFQVPQALALRGSSPWLILGAPTAPLMRLQFTQAGNLECFSAAGTLSPTAFTQTITWPGGFLPNKDYLVDVTWKRGQYREIAIDGTTVVQGALTEPDGGFVKPTELRLGIYNYNASFDGGWTISLSDWQLGEEPETPLGP